MTQYQQIIGDADQLVESGKGLRFEIAPKEAEANAAPERLPAFVIRHQGGFFAYLNRCGHIAVPLDFMPGEFFTEDGVLAASTVQEGLVRVVDTDTRTPRSDPRLQV